MDEITYNLQNSLTDCGWLMTDWLTYGWLTDLQYVSDWLTDWLTYHLFYFGSKLVEPEYWSRDQLDNAALCRCVRMWMKQDCMGQGDVTIWQTSWQLTWLTDWLIVLNKYILFAGQAYPWITAESNSTLLYLSFYCNIFTKLSSQDWLID